MTVVEYRTPTNNELRKRITVCPACGEEAPLRYADHLETHAPEDFGLTPLRQ